MTATDNTPTWTVSWTSSNMWGRTFTHKVTADNMDTAHVLSNLLNNARKGNVRVTDPAGRPWDRSMLPPAPDWD
ncbi:hypothetical protein ACODT3_42445 [Streptomyces sp. 4.24]|uniref:hypothetical protein n=1 Tax=Streptomyces tritrimontium TaxID=3406573 RepID=UPI003BB71AB8